MSILSLKLEQASKLFMQGNYPKSLKAYQECLDFCKKTDESKTIIFNILSIKGNIEYLLGQYDTALQTLNSVLKKDPNHFLCLLRRSQVYKQKHKFKKALKDIETIQMFYPNNQRILSLKSQIGNILSTHQKQQEVSSQSQLQQEEEMLQLNFMKLKKIDRKSLDSSSMKQRKSQVTLLGDTTFQYKKEDDLEGTKDNENVKDKAVRTYSQIQLDYDQDSGQKTPVIHIIYEKTPKKSLLKNKGDKVFIQEEDVQSRRSKYLGKESHLLNLIKNIDGKVILSAEHEHHSNPQIKEVEFRKSISSTNEFNMMEESTKALSIKSQRKSCLRRPNTEIPHMKSQQIRRSKFQMINEFQIDGRIISHKKRNSLDKSGQVKTQLKEERKDDSQSDDSSQHNIFGSKRYFLTTEMKHQLGIGQNTNQKKKQQTENQGHFLGKKSILRKVSTLGASRKSLLVKSKSNCQQPTELPLNLCSIKSKKSVLFNCTL